MDSASVIARSRHMFGLISETFCDKKLVDARLKPARRRPDSQTPSD